MTPLELVQHYYGCFNRKDWEGMLGCLAADVRHEINQSDSQIGVDAFRDFLLRKDACYDEQYSDLIYMTEPTGTRVACEFQIKGVYKQTDGDQIPARNQEYDMQAGAFFEIAEGKIIRVTPYYNLHVWLKLVWA